MTDVTEDRDQDGPELSAADEQVLRELTERARTGGLKLTGEGGLLGRLTKMVIEGALEGELDDHLGYGKHHPKGRDGGNSRNGRRVTTVVAVQQASACYLSCIAEGCDCRAWLRVICGGQHYPASRCRTHARRPRRHHLPHSPPIA